MKIKVVPRLRFLERVSESTIGMYVPRSPMAPLSSDNVEWKFKLFFTFCMVVSLVGVVVGRIWGFDDAMKGRFFFFFLA